MLEISVVACLLLGVSIGLLGKKDQKIFKVLSLICVGIITGVVGILVAEFGEVMVIPGIGLSVWPGAFFGGLAIIIGGIILLIRVLLSRC